jgi:hypothetical protein
MTTLILRLCCQFVNRVELEVRQWLDEGRGRLLFLHMLLLLFRIPLCPASSTPISTRIFFPPIHQYLPVIVPTEAEKADPRLFAARTQRTIAHALGVPATLHSFDDVIMSSTAKRLHYPPEEAIVALAQVKSVFDLTTSDAKVRM